MPANKFQLIRLLDNCCEKGPKRHRTLGRRRRLSAKKKAKVKAATVTRLAAFRRFKERVRSYWRGDADGHP